jgi:hypothetical protein
MDQTRGNSILNAILRQSQTASTTNINVLLGSTSPSATATMTQLPNGNGYTTGGSTCTFAVASAEASSNTSVLTWTNTSGGWTINGIELWDSSGSGVRWLQGTWVGAPISVASGNSFSVQSGGIAVSIQLAKVFPCDTQDNRPENLQLRNGNHGKGVVMQCACCGSRDIRAVPLD